MRIKDIQLSSESVQALQKSRNQLQAVRRAYKRYNMAQAEHPIISSPRLDGMPRGSLNTSGLEKRYISLEKYKQDIEREEHNLEQARCAARRVIYCLPDVVQDFCHWYYIEGMSVQDVAAYIDRDISTCWRFKRVLEHEASPDGQNAASERFID